MEQQIPQPENLPVQPTEEVAAVGYGYTEDEVKASANVVFGLNCGTVTLVKFEFNDKAGKDGADGDALDIGFVVDGRETNHRQFPVTKAFTKDGGEVDDPRHPDFQKAVKELNSTVVHVLKAFVPGDTIRTAFSAPIASFEQYCRVATALLPPGYENKKLDLFMQYEWQIRGDNDRTWLRIPKSVKHGYWLVPHIPPQDGDWEEKIVGGKLTYVDGAGNVHPFERSKWFMDSPFAHLQEQPKLDDVNTGTPTAQQWD